MAATATTTDARPIAVEFELIHPFTAASGETIDRIQLRRGTRADMRASSHYSDNEFDNESFLLARLAGLTMEDLDQLDMQDNAELVRRFQIMLGHKPS